MSVRSAAIAAYQASQSGREDEARAVLSGVLDPLDVSWLTVADVETTNAYARYVVTDGDVHLAVVLRASGVEVHLVKGGPGEWTDLATITSLSQLGKVLPGLLPSPAPPSGPDAWAPDVDYTTGDEVSYGGETYMCVQGHTSQTGWEPSAVPSLWAVA